MNFDAHLTKAVHPGKERSHLFGGEDESQFVETILVLLHLLVDVSNKDVKGCLSIDNILLGHLDTLLDLILEVEKLLHLLSGGTDLIEKDIIPETVAILIELVGRTGEDPSEETDVYRHLT